MRLFFTFLLALLFADFNALQAQVSKDVTVPLVATLNTGPTSVSLSWTNPGNANLLILRRTKGQAGNAWVQLVNLTGSNANALMDNGVANGQIYEYVIQRTVNNINAFGYAHVAVNAAPVNSRGKILIFVDSTTADALGPELVRMKNDMRGDGWWPIPFHTGPSSTVKSIKDQIVASYNADPNNVKAVLLLGTVPIPYSGDASWDGHSDHQGAWPCDAYYADVNGIWTDASVNNVTPGRAANDNVPGDGKFDQSYIPTAVELQVGRVDFRRINAVAFGATDQIGLMKRYLDKNHRWRIGDYAVQNKALVDDNFGYFGGEAFAANGFRNAYPLVGEANIVEADFFLDTNPQSYLLGFGTGGGTYQSAGGVGSSADFAVDSVNIVFSNLFGSYHGDWDYESDPFMPSALASRGGILTCSWAGRPHWFNQYLASGETVGYCTKETMNAQFNNGFFGSFGESGAHIALLGDPTLRANVVKPSTNVTVTAPTCNSVVVTWDPSAESVDGYHIYRAPSQDGPYTRLTTNPVTGTTFTDNAPLLDTLYYQVRAIKNVTNPGGGTYANNAIGPIKSIVFTGAGAPEVTTVGGTLNCASPNLTIQANSDIPVITWSWVGPNNFSSSLQNPTVSNSGIYTVTATDASGCSGTATVTVLADNATPAVSIGTIAPLTCVNTSTPLTASSNAPGATFSWSGPCLSGGTNATCPGVYTVTVTNTATGCTNTASTTVVRDIDSPSLAAQGGTITCNTAMVPLNATVASGTTVQWSGPCLVPGTPPMASCAGIYTAVATSTANGCTNSVQVFVLADTQLPTISIIPPAPLTCASPCALFEVPNLPGLEIYFMGQLIQPGTPIQLCEPGVFTITVKSINNGCTQDIGLVVSQDINVPTANAGADVTLICNNPTGQLSSAGSSSGANFSILWTGPGGFSSNQPNPTVTTPGVYTLQIVNTQNGCTSTDLVQVFADQNLPTVNATANGQLNCANQTVQLQSGNTTAGAVYAWTGPGGFTSSLSNPVVSAPGTYTVVVTVGGCSATDAVEVIKAQDLVVNSGIATVDCDGITSLCVDVTGGTPPYALLWSNGTTGNCATYTPPVSISVKVTDNGGCVFQSPIIQVVQPNPIVLTTTVTNASSPTANNGSINLSVSGGTGVYIYLWSNGAQTQDISNLTVGIYTCTVTDANGCTKTITVAVNSPTGTEEASVFEQFLLSPNPTEGLSALTIQLHKASSMRVEIRDIAGRLIQENTVQETQVLQLPIDLTQSPAGVYTVSVLIDNQVFVRKLAIIR